MVLFGVCVAAVSGMEEVEVARRRLERQYKKRIPDVEIRFSSNIYGGLAIHPQKLPRMSQEQKDEIYRNWDSDLKSHGLEDSEIQNLDRSKITVFMPPYYGKNATTLYGTLCEELGHYVAYAYGIENKIPNEGVALACRFKGLLEAAEEGRFPLEKVIEQIEDDVKQYMYAPFAFFMHYNKALDFIRRYNPDLTLRDRDPNELMMELNRSIDYILKTSERIRYDLQNLGKRTKTLLRKK